ncbi:MAG: sulfotransferase [Caulobacteraceae bacterium]|nr:sulfotransferase [Caulobacteraceae bacterium]
MIPEDPAARVAALVASIDRIEQAMVEPPALDDDEPVFLASIGWRSGSTLMQRILMTDPGLLVWGEPLSHLLYLNRLVEPLFGFTEIWPEMNHWISRLPKLDLTRDWIAHVAPDAGHLKGAYRAFLDRWLATPARERGFSRWGVKQVRWSGEEAIALRWLYPRAKFILMVRHPVSAYQSMKNIGFVPNEMGFVLEWPDRWIADLDAYAAYWDRLARSWGAASARMDVTWVRYEDLMDGRTDFDALGRATGLDLEPSTAMSVVAGGPVIRSEMTPEERDRINALTVEGRRIFAYAE